ncbi:hypothetical protein Niako_7094 [Niastella koreensis GR20-10]|uniref:Uncharacterized protein n=1 Tax=Niastella koreensis (strain DSM 17620 / KACC 11465 / NBRC 106392 / GR20-10) TaxID=700598 RepID=G8TRY0_NIAKG|nr:hypothetical protein Niako_7094 [Niastella koreensis GR20-10]
MTGLGTSTRHCTGTLLCDIHEGIIEEGFLWMYVSTALIQLLRILF